MRFNTCKVINFSNFSIIFVLLNILLTAIMANATTFVVNNNADTFDNNTSDNRCLDFEGNCTLRAAIQQANYSVGDDTIEFALASPDTISLTRGQLNLASNISIIGPGARNLTIQRSTIEGTPNFRIFSIGGFAIDNVAVSFSGITVTNGKVDGTSDTDTGGAINNYAGLTGKKYVLTLNEVVIKNNFANRGGGIFSNVEMHVTNSVISGNRSKGSGAGINSNGNGKATIINSTITNNTEASVAGAIFNAGELTLINCTISNNMATGYGGGIVASYDSPIHLRNTIIALNNAPFYVDFFRFGNERFISFENTLIGNNSGVEAIFPEGNPNSNGDRVGTAANPINPMLGELLNNGGQTDTRALLFGSPAIDAGNNLDAPGTDQRGFARIVGGTVDIGAFEFVPVKSRKRVRFF